MKKIFKTLAFYLIPLLLFTIPVLLYFSQKKLIIFPNTEYSISSFADSQDNGNSLIRRIEVNQDRIVLKYMLRDDYNYPYIGLSFRGENSLNLKKYDRVKIKINTFMSKNLFMQLHSSYITNISDKEINDYIVYLHEIPVWKKRQEYILNLNDFIIPEWWFENYGINEFDLNEKKDLSKIIYLDISSTHYLPMNVEDTIVIEEICFYQSKTYIFLITFFIVLLYYLILTIYLIIKFIEKILIKKYSIVISYKSLNLANYIDEDSKKLFSYLKENFKNPDLTVQMTSENCGLTVLKIPQIIKKVHNLTFPQYLNVLRIMEAKRILKNTDEQIVNIAFRVGYNHLSHFNYIFKKMVKSSPKEFRKKTSL